jgi:hypothetical protein
MLQDGALTTVHTLSVFHIAGYSATLGALFTSASALASSYIQCPYRQPMCKFLPRHPHSFISVARLPLLLPPSTSQEDNDRFSAELRDGHTKIPNLELEEDGSRGRSAAKFLSTFFCFAGKKL